MARRSRDDGQSASAYQTSIDVCCPRCKLRARVSVAAADTETLWHKGASRLACTHCGLVRLAPAPTIQMHRGARDPCFGLPLWLSIATRHGDLFAYNQNHLDALKAYVGATLRERHTLTPTMLRNATLQSRLPRWIKSASHRDEILKALDRLEAKART